MLAKFRLAKFRLAKLPLTSSVAVALAAALTLSPISSASAQTPGAPTVVQSASGSSAKTVVFRRHHGRQRYRQYGYRLHYHYNGPIPLPPLGALLGVVIPAPYYDCGYGYPYGYYGYPYPYCGGYYGGWVGGWGGRHWGGGGRFWRRR